MLNRSIIKITTLGAMLLSVGTAATAADTTQPYYRATISHGVAPEGVISSGMAWLAQGNELHGSENGNQPWMVCAELAHDVGAISAFSAEGKALTPDRLAYCNKNARKAKG
jgi:hypothetical protein